jgi:hypothetical protein
MPMNLRAFQTSIALCACVGLGACKHDNALDAPPSAGATAASSGAESQSTQSTTAGSAGDATSERAAPAGLSFEAAMQAYTTWTRETDEPQSISVQIASLCRAPSAAELAFDESEHGKNLYTQDWLNPAAKRGQEAAGGTPFAAGAAIVKQKLAVGADGKLAVVALGMMIKRESGFDAEHGDWAFGYWEAALGLKSGPSEARHCGGCHASSVSDFVFLDQRWRLPP